MKGEPHSTVLYDTIYADGSNGMTKPRPGSSGNGKTDAEGTFHTTWALAADVPPGQAEVNVIASDGARSPMVTATFEVVAVGTRC